MPLLPGHQEYFHGLKQPNLEADNSPPLNAKFKHMRNWNSIVPYIYDVEV
jgi:hypothetical protein